ncbi:MAG: ECF transporter S component [Ruminococcaceae bacterium]|nr:ECF transporter S component [Oscillospiraceae bacterium]
MRRIKRISIKKLVCIAMFAALAYAVTYIKIPVAFLSLEVKDSLIVLCTLIFGLPAGLAIAVLVPLLELITHSSTGVYGLVMNILSSVTFSMVTGLIYKYKKNFYGAIIGLISGIVSVTAVMLVANMLITPYYMGVSADAVIKLIPTMLLPFNLVKATLNGAIVLLLYKPISTVLRRAGFIEKRIREGDGTLEDTMTQSSEKKTFGLRSVLVTLIAVAIIAGSLCIIYFVLRK